MSAAGRARIAEAARNRWAAAKAAGTKRYSSHLLGQHSAQLMNIGLRSVGTLALVLAMSLNSCARKERQKDAGTQFCEITDTWKTENTNVILLSRDVLKSDSVLYPYHGTVTFKVWNFSRFQITATCQFNGTKACWERPLRYHATESGEPVDLNSIYTTQGSLTEPLTKLDDLLMEYYWVEGARRAAHPTLR